MWSEFRPERNVIWIGVLVNTTSNKGLKQQHNECTSSTIWVNQQKWKIDQQKPRSIHQETSGFKMFEQWTMGFTQRIIGRRLTFDRMIRLISDMRRSSMDGHSPVWHSTWWLVHWCTGASSHWPNRIWLWDHGTIDYPGTGFEATKTDVFRCAIRVMYFAWFKHDQWEHCQRLFNRIQAA